MKHCKYFMCFLISLTIQADKWTVKKVMKKSGEREMVIFYDIDSFSNKILQLLSHNKILKGSMKMIKWILLKF